MATAQLDRPQRAFPFPDPQPAQPRPPLRRPQAVLDAPASEAAKVAGMERAAERASDAFWADVLVEFRQWSAQQRAAGAVDFVVEDFRAVSRCKPPSPNCWGSLPKKAGARAVRYPDGMPKKRNAKSVTTHSHPVTVWELV